MRYEDGDWQEFNETTLTEKKVTQLVRRLKGLAYDVEHLIRKLGSLQADPQDPAGSS